MKNKILKLSKISFIITLACLNAGCATLLATTHEKINLVSTKKINCLVANNHGQWAVQAPATIKVSRSLKPLTISCSWSGHKESQIIKAKINPLSAAIVASEFIFIPGGSLIAAGEAASGCLFTYPKKINV